MSQLYVSLAVQILHISLSILLEEVKVQKIPLLQYIKGTM